MKRYVRIYIQLLKTNYAYLSAYRSNFINNLFASFAWGVFSLSSVIFLTSGIGSAFGLTRTEILLFNGMYGIVVGIYHMFLSVNMRRFARTIHMGELDMLLVKPIDSQFALSLWRVDYTMVIRLLMAIGYTVWIVRQLALTIPVWQYFAIGTLGFFSLTLLYSLWYGVLTILIWNSSLSNLVLLLFSYESMARFPKEIATQLTGLLFGVALPMTLVVNVPVRIMLSRWSLPDTVLLIGLACILFVAVRRFWKFALRYYSSASS